MADRARTFTVGLELLDNAVLDEHRRPMGCVDGLTIQLPDDGPPRVTHLELGGVAMAIRTSWPFRPVLMWLARRFGAQHGEPFRIAWRDVASVGVDVCVRVDGESTPALHFERVLRERVVRHIPGA